MKAIDIIEAMTCDPALAENADVWEYDARWPSESVKEWISQMFGQFHVKAGTITVGKYLCVWECHGNDINPFQVQYTPDVLLVRDDPSEAEPDDQEIWLWRIE